MPAEQPSDGDVRRMHESNRIAWNEAAEGYTPLIERDAATLRAGGTHLRPIELEQLGDLHGWCTRAIHLQCASGADSLSLVNLGAAEVVGVDISERHIENARRTSALLDFSARWYRVDLLDTPAELDGTADLVYTGKGAIWWLHDLAAWARVVARLLRPGGRLYLFEEHPITWLFKENADRYERYPEWSYFRTEPDVSRGWPAAYLDLGKPAEEQATKYGRLWPVSEIISSLVGAGLRLDRFTEHPDDPYGFAIFPNIPDDERRSLPQSFALQMHRP